MGEPLDVYEEGDRLLEVGEEKVEDKEKELVLDAMGFSPPLEEEITAESDEEKECGNERQQAEDDDGLQAFANGLRQR